MVIRLLSASIYFPRYMQSTGRNHTDKKACLKVSLENEREKVVEETSIFMEIR